MRAISREMLHHAPLFELDNLLIIAQSLASFLSLTILHIIHHEFMLNELLIMGKKCRVWQIFTS